MEQIHQQEQHNAARPGIIEDEHLSAAPLRVVGVKDSDDSCVSSVTFAYRDTELYASSIYPSTRELESSDSDKEPQMPPLLEEEEPEETETTAQTTPSVTTVDEAALRQEKEKLQAGCLGPIGGAKSASTHDVNGKEESAKSADGASPQKLSSYPESQEKDGTKIAAQDFITSNSGKLGYGNEEDPAGAHAPTTVVETMIGSTPLDLPVKRMPDPAEPPPDQLAPTVIGIPTEDGGTIPGAWHVGRPSDDSSNELHHFPEGANEAASNAVETSMEEGLAEAQAVEESSTQGLPVAHAMNRHQGRKNVCRSLWGKLIGGFIVISLVVAVIATTLKRQKGSGADSSDQGTEMEQVAVENRIMGALNVIVGDTLDLEDPDSPHSKALDWLLHEDELMLSANARNLLQRYVLALFYFSTTQNGPWTVCNPPAPEEGILCYYLGRTGDGLWWGGGLDYIHHTSEYLEQPAARWLTGQHECQWAGLYCDHETKKVERIHLDAMNLTGTLPDEISLLAGLKTISLTRNYLWGWLPSSLVRLGNLEFLDLEDNTLSGTLPNDWWGLTCLTHLNVGYNPLGAWRIPSSVASWSNLEHLMMVGNHITGPLPIELFHLTKLSYLMLFENDITGTIATEVGLLSNMQIFSVHYTQVSGSIPSEIAQMTNLLELALAGLGLVGTIPEELYLADYSKLSAIMLIHNKLTGTISTNIGKLSTLKFLYLDYNPHLRGTLPTEVGILTNLKKISMSFSQLSGSIPKEVCANRGEGYLSRVKADCAALADGSIPMFCPQGCCTKCCNQTSGECLKTGY